MTVLYISLHICILREQERQGEMDHPPLIDMYMYMLVYECMYMQTNEVFSEVGEGNYGDQPNTCMVKL